MTSLSYITWQRHAGRADEIASALGGRAVHVHPRLPGRGTGQSLARYAVSSVLTVGHLLRRRPQAVVVTNPPVVPGLLVTAYGALGGRRVVLDSHPTSFGAKDHAVSQRLLPLHAAMARRAAAVMVTTQQWVDVVEGWGGRGLVVHEAPPRWRVEPWRPHSGRPRVLFVGVFGSDEPVEAVAAAARELPGVDVDITGDPRRCPPDLAAALPPNARLVGFLDPEAYRRAVEAADVLLVLTTEPTSVVRAGYEAVYAGRELVLSDTPVLREVFPQAVAVANTGAAVAEGVRRALGRIEDAAHREEATALQVARWQGQLAALSAAVAGPAPQRRRQGRGRAGG